MHWALLFFGSVVDTRRLIHDSIVDQALTVVIKNTNCSDSVHL
jgi:hypothetical protein